MLLLKEDIPVFIQSSQYLQSLQRDGSWPEKGLEIPDGCCKKDLTFANDADLVQLLETIRFWRVPEVAEQVSELSGYALNPSEPNGFVSIANDFGTDISFVGELLAIHHAQDKVDRASWNGRLSVLKILCEELALPPSVAAGVSAAKGGHLECLQYLHSRGLAMSKSIHEAACANGHFECAKYAIGLDPSFQVRFHAPTLLELAAKNGHADCVKLLLEQEGWSNERYIFSLLRCAASAGHLRVLEAGLQYPFSTEGLREVMLAAAAGGHVDCIAYLLEKGCKLHASHMESAAGEGHLHAMKLLHQNKCPWNQSVCQTAAAAGQLECLKYAHENGCPLKRPRDTSYDNEDVDEEDREDHEEDENFVDIITADAARAPTAACLEYVVAHGAVLDPQCAQAALGGMCVDTLKFLHARGMTWDARDLNGAAGGGWLEGLIYLRSIGTPWDVSTTYAAVRSRNAAVLLYVLQGQCPWTDKVLELARALGDAAQECVLFMEQNSTTRVEAPKGWGF